MLYADIGGSCSSVVSPECTGLALRFHAEEKGLGLSCCEMIHVWGMCIFRKSEISRGLH